MPEPDAPKPQSQGALEDLAAVLQPLLRAMDALGFIGRYFNPPDFGELMQTVGAPDASLREALPRLETWPEPLAGVKGAIQTASDHALAAFDGLRSAAGEADGMRAVYRALGQAPRAQEALYPLAAPVPPISRFFLEPEARGDTALLHALRDAEPRDDVGVFHVDNEPGSRAGFSLYVPEYYSADRAWPVVMALHGGAGNGRSFLWTWLRAARSFGAILAAPTAVGDTWALHGPDVDFPNLERILGEISARWNVDADHLLLTGMSDGGTFAYLSGLQAPSSFTHLAPNSAAFHPFMVELADPERLKGLPIHIVHGALDWMFDVALAREAEAMLAAAGARVAYREITDLSHTYPREANAGILKWLMET